VRGEVVKEVYERFVDNGVKSDQILFWFERPAGVISGYDEEEVGRVGGEKKLEG
jgi:hypothetical protein